MKRSFWMAAGARPWAAMAPVLAGLVCTVPVRAAHAPDWVNAAIAETVDWRVTAPAQYIYRSMTVRYLSADHQHILVEERGVVHSNKGGRTPLVANAIYHPNTGKIVSANGWTISDDGKTVETFHKGDFADTVTSYNGFVWDQQRMIVLEAANRLSGASAAWDIQYEDQTPFRQWDMDFVHPLPCYRTEFEAIPFLGGKIEWSATNPRIGEPTVGSAPGALKWTVVRTAPRTADRPTGFLFDPLHLVVRCTDAAQPPGATSWESFSRSLASFVDPQLDSGGEVKATSQKLVEGKTARWERIRALTDFVQKDIVYLSVDLDRDSLEGCRPHPSGEVLRNRFGDCKDKAALLVSMLKAIGETGRVVLLAVEAGPAYVNDKWPADYFDHVIAAIPADDAVPASWPVVDLPGLGKFVIFDPTESRTPLGVLPGHDQEGFGLVVDSAHGQIFRLPRTAAADSRIVMRIHATLEPTGAVAVRVRDDRSGDAGARAYENRAARSHEDYLKVLERRADVASPSAVVDKWNDEWNPREAHFGLSVDYSAIGYGRVRSNGMITVAPNLYVEFPRFTPWKTNADGVVYLPADNFDNEVRLKIPGGYHVEELPDPWACAAGIVKGALGYSVEGDTVVFTCRVIRESGFYSLEQYEQLREAYRQLSDNAKRPVLLMKGATGGT